MIVVGEGLTLVSAEPRREPNGLTFVDYIYEGVQSEVDTTIANLSSDYGYRVDKSDAPKIRLVISDPNPTDATENEDMAFHWEMPGQDEAKSLLEHPIVVSWPPKMQDSLRTRVNNEFDETYDERVAELVAAATEYLDDLPENIRNGLVVGFFNNILNEQSLLVPQHVLRLNQKVGSRYSRQISDIGNRRLYSGAQIVAEANINGTPIPARLQYKLDNISPPLDAQGDPITRVIDETYGVNNFSWGWLKKTSSEQQVAYGMIEIQTEWVLDLWSELSYPPI